MKHDIIVFLYFFFFFSKMSMHNIVCFLFVVVYKLSLSSVCLKLWNALKFPWIAWRGRTQEHVRNLSGTKIKRRLPGEDRTDWSLKKRFHQQPPSQFIKCLCYSPKIQSICQKPYLTQIGLFFYANPALTLYPCIIFLNTGAASLQSIRNRWCGKEEARELYQAKSRDGPRLGASGKRDWASHELHTSQAVSARVAWRE